ncbi:MAG TPA: hypothetical protein VJ840_04645 [Gemmatimonadaceae bacterium]|nr:hypothetical protein [Gemmatimonadaceae bacterium]
MPEILVKFDEPIPRSDGVEYFAQACARERNDGLWEGWLEFRPVAGDGDSVNSGRETTQPNRNAVMYWAQGLSRVYLMGALERAVSPTPSIERDRLNFLP